MDVSRTMARGGVPAAMAMVLLVASPTRAMPLCFALPESTVLTPEKRYILLGTRGRKSEMNDLFALAPVLLQSLV